MGDHWSSGLQGAMAFLAAVIQANGSDMQMGLPLEINGDEFIFQGRLRSCALQFK
jgi:hypothetical protein